MFSRINMKSRMIASFLLFAAIGAIAGCGSKSVSEEITSSAVISVTTSPSSVTKGQTAVIEATITDNGVAVPNQVVTFSVVPIDAGSFAPVTDTTDASGIVAAVFTAITSGSATITVSVAGSTLEKTTGMTITEVAQVGSGNITLSMSPSLLLANGSDTSRINITVRDASGQAAPDSTLVKIVAGEKFIDLDSNGYWSPGVDSLVFDANANGSWDAIGNIQSTAYTSGGGGLASVSFVSGNNSGTVYIKATVDDNGITGNVEASVQLNPNATVDAIYTWNDSISISVKGTGGIETGFVNALCLDEFGNPVPEGLQVQFLIINGPSSPGDPVKERLGNVGYGPYYSVTNGQGVATATVHSGIRSGTIRIRASVDTVLSEASQIMVTSGPPAYIVAGAEVCNASYWDNVGLIVKVEAVVGDIYHNPVNDSTVVYFTVDEGTIKANIARTEKGEGRAYTDWFAGHHVPPADGRVFVIAETGGGTVVDTTMFYNTHFLDTLIVTSSITSLLADGRDKATINIDGMDLNGNPVIDNTVFKSSARYIAVPGAKLKNGCGIAGAVIELTSSTLSRDESLTGANDDGIGAVDYIQFYAEEGRASTVFPVQLLTDVSYRSNCKLTVDPLSGDYGDEVVVTLVINDRYLNPLGDHSIVATATNGGVIAAPTTRETDAFGAVEFLLTLPPASSGAKEVKVTVEDFDGRGMNLRFKEDISIITDPQLAVWPAALSFGTTGTTSQFNISNNGTGTINWNLTADVAWITVSPTSGSTISGPDVITVTVNRAGLTTGTYNGSISLTSDAGSKTIGVTMDVP